ncbi:holo-ACP synthase [Streptomyces klenkii]|uniref:Holo-[acyl-carrier-protein] synthase n=1 Tax=Streptomyces klenkii TaxID=1420899 RepID=A0A3B0BJX8_9ACTN|nr:holo-ACP synthase [Streptomyces klenkii]
MRRLRPRTVAGGPRRPVRRRPPGGPRRRQRRRCQRRARVTGTAIRVGVDLVPLTRVQAMTDAGDDARLRRMLTPAEIALSRTATGWDLHGVAGRFAAKEAVFKLLHVPGRPLPWQSIEILKSPGEWPFVHLTGPARGWAADAGIEAVDVSISHEELFAVAVAATAAARPGHAHPHTPAHTDTYPHVDAYPQTDTHPHTYPPIPHKEEPHAEHHLVQP